MCDGEKKWELGDVGACLRARGYWPGWVAGYAAWASKKPRSTRGFCQLSWGTKKIFKPEKHRHLPECYWSTISLRLLNPTRRVKGVGLFFAGREPSPSGNCLPQKYSGPEAGAIPTTEYF